MIAWMLKRLEMNPRATFLEGELNRFRRDFEEARADGLVRSVGLDDSVRVEDRVLEVMDDETGLRAFDEDDIDFEPLQVAPGDVRRWRLDLERLVTIMREQSAVAGPSGELEPRLWMVGRKEDRGVEAAVVLAFLHQPTEALRVLKGLPLLTPEGVERWDVYCPSFVADPSQYRELATAGINLALLDATNPTLLAPAVGAGARARKPEGARRKRGRGGRPPGRSFGALLECWMKCGGLEAFYGGAQAAHDAVTAYMVKHPEFKPPPPASARYSRSRSDARAANRKQGCPWYRHPAPVPSELLSD